MPAEENSSGTHRRACDQLDAVDRRRLCCPHHVYSCRADVGDRSDPARHGSGAKGKDLPAPSDKGALSLHVFDDNSVSLNGKKVNMKELVALLKVAKRQNPKGIPQVFQDKKAFFGTYQAVKNAAEESGFEQMDVVLKPS